MSNLPLSWSSTPLSSIITHIQAGLNVKCEERPPENGERGLIKISAVTWGKFDEDQSKTLPVDEVVDDRNLIRKGDLLISRANTIELVGSAVLVGDFSRRLYLSDKVLRLVMGDEFKRWVNYALKLPATRKAIQEASSGNQLSMRNISQDKLLGLAIPFAPLAEQTRIADKLDTVLTRVDACRDRLARVAPLLKRFRQSVLAAATSGRLTEDWRTSLGLTMAGKGILPITWRIATASDVCQSVRDGTHDTPSYVENGIPLVTSKNISPKGIDFEGVKYISHADHLEISRRSGVSRGDILISMIGTVGQICIVACDAEFSIKNVGLFRVAHEKCLPEYLFYWLQSPSYGMWLQENMRGGNQKFISLGLLRKSLVNTPPIEEQTEIVRRVETLFAFADRLEARLKTAQTAADRLTPALLAKAFRGELVPQDPNDEPAAELLKRLAASRDAAPKAKRGRRSATADTTP